MITTTTTETYNGWTNRETWLVNLWLSNDADTYNAVRGLCAADLRTFVDGMIDEQGDCYKGAFDGFFGDLLNAAAARVDWDELAGSLNAE